MKTQVTVTNARKTPQQKHIDQLNQVVLQNFETLMIGTDRLGDLGIEVQEADFWAPNRILILHSNERRTRLHQEQGIKAIAGIKTVDGCEERDFSHTVEDRHIEELIVMLNKIFEAAADPGHTALAIEVKDDRK